VAFLYSGPNLAAVGAEQTRLGASVTPLDELDKHSKVSGCTLVTPFTRDHTMSIRTLIASAAVLSMSTAFAASTVAPNEIKAIETPIQSNPPANPILANRR
jgi:hypothetical protein